MADFTRQYGPFYRQYGTATAAAGINPHIRVGIPTSTDANLYTGALAAGDVKVSIDGGAEANVGTLPTQIGATGVWNIILSNAELAGFSTAIHIKKAGSTAEIVITIETTLALGRVLVDASQVGGNINAVQLQGLGTGNGLLSSGGNTGAGINLRGGAAGGAGLDILANGGNQNGITCGGNGSGAGMYFQGGASGSGAVFQGFTAGHGLNAISGVSDGAYGIKAQAGIGGSGGFFGDASATNNVNGGTGIRAAGGNAGDGIKSDGQGAGAGAIFTGGATGIGVSMKGGSGGGQGCKAFAQAGNNAGLECIGAGSGNGITATAGGSGKICNLFDTLEGAEPASVIGASATFAQILQFLKRYNFNKVTATSAQITVFKDDNATALYTMAVADDGTTASKARAI